MILLITGATAGFGEATARMAIGQGMRVIACGRRRERLDALHRELGDALLPIVLDVRDRPAVAHTLAQLPEAWRAVDVLVNNAGLALGLDKAHEASLSDWETMVETNILGVLACTQALLPGMVARGRGHIVNLGSIAGNYPYPGGNVYGATKAFLKQLTLNLKADLLGTPVRVTNIEPGMAETEFSNIRFKGDDAKADAVYANTQPLTAEDIARTILWCITQPPHVNINRIEIMATQQAFSPFAVARSES